MTEGKRIAGARCGSWWLAAAWSLLALAACPGDPLADGLPGTSTCGDCHGGAENFAPPSALLEPPVTTSVGVGAHQAHLQGGRVTQAIACTECHQVPETIEDPAHIDTLPADLTWGPLATRAGLSPEWRREQRSCANTYCHGASLQGGTASTPEWTRVDSSQIQCGSCHGNPPPAPHPAGAGCESCHPETMTPRGDLDVTAGTHIDGVVQAVGGALHPAGYADPLLHGQDTKDQVSDCRDCHGATLDGDGAAPSCDQCHQPGWRSNCVYCHGGHDNATGAPPVDLIGATGTSVRSVGSHTAHVTGTDHPTYACDACHRTPTDVLSAAHVFDDSPQVAEVHFGPLNPQGSYAAPGCTSLYCHGNGRAAGDTSNFAGNIDSCDACHRSGSSTSEEWREMSGKHRRHLEEGIACYRCHAEVLDSSDQVRTPDLHVNGGKDVQMAVGSYQVSDKSCYGLGTGCHDDGESW